MRAFECYCDPVGGAVEIRTPDGRTIQRLGGAIIDDWIADEFMESRLDMQGLTMTLSSRRMIPGGSTVYYMGDLT